MRYFLVLMYFFIACTSCAQESSGTKTERSSFRLGDRTIPISYTVYDSAQPYVIVQLHGNESSAFDAARQTLESQSGIFLRIEHTERNISFRLQGRRYTFDPNRMFSRKGIRESLQTYGNYSVAALDAVAAFASFFLSRIPDSAVIIAVHNNSDNRFSAASYRIDPEYRNVATEVNLNDVLDPDNFYLITDEKIFSAIKNLNYNAVLQNNPKAPDDGSLSIYCGRNNRPYINIEAQSGETMTQQTMLEELVMLIKARE